MLKKIAVTGGLASGKSTFCHMLQELGAVVVSADQIVHQLILHSSPLKKQIVALLGSEVIVNGEIDRKKVADQVFQSETKSATKLAQLEALLHPLVREEIERLYNEELKKKSAILFVVEIPLLFETEDASFYDATVALRCREEQQLARSSLTHEEFIRRQSRQLSNQEKETRATFVIDNSGSLDNLKKQANGLYQQLS